MYVLLIPHVVLDHGDDRIINRYLFEKYKGSGRIAMIEDCKCEVIKGYISRCRFFVGARTHATIAHIQVVFLHWFWDIL
jgi:polysaccharide pyruvyl transferase WcaK-like protein